MRPDMFKVIVERPRAGHALPNNNNRIEGRAAKATKRLDDLPLREAMKTPSTSQRSRRKTLNENLAPLRKFLVSRVGEQWDVVYSDIRSVLNARSTTQKHVLEHVGDFVIPANEIIYVDGTPHHKTDGELPVSFRRYRTMYVCPLTGTLVQPDRRARRPAKPPPNKNVFRAGKLETWIRINGLWFGFGLAKTQEKTYIKRTLDPRIPTLFPSWTLPGLLERYGRNHIMTSDFDLYLNEYASTYNVTTRHRLYGDSTLYACTKRSLSKKDLKRLPTGWR